MVIHRANMNPAAGPVQAENYVAGAL